MRERKELKKWAKQSLKKHYWMFVVVCLIAAFLGVEFSSSLDLFKIDTEETKEVDEESVTGVDSVGTLRGEEESVFHQVLLDVLRGDLAQGEEVSDEAEAEAKEEADRPDEIFGRSRGVFAKIVNGLSSGAIVVTAARAFESVQKASSAAAVLLILGSLLLATAFWFLIQNVYKVISRRIFLEGRTYEKLSVNRLLFLGRVRKWGKAAWTMCLTYIFHSLWSLTVVGGFIKYYSYFLVPYIVAENPDIKATDAITLSRKMMNGHKWECFCLELSFIGWALLELVTFGLSGIFFSNPYAVATYAEYYENLRELAKKNNLPGSELLNDRYLYEKAEAETVQTAYADVMPLLNQPEVQPECRSGLQKFLTKVFGMELLNTPAEMKYEHEKARQIHTEKLEDQARGQAYPCRLGPIPSKEPKEDKICFVRNYSLPSLILMFFTFSFIGWVWEVSLHLISDGVFVNRGVLHGPWLPIYGTGGVLILIILHRLREKPPVEFLAAVILCGTVEYFTSVYLEAAHGGERWWNYSGYFLNLHGRICAEGLLVFGIGGMAIVYILAPLLDNFYRQLNTKVLLAICAVILVLYAGDQQYSAKHPNTGKGITNYASGAASESAETLIASLYKLSTGNISDSIFTS